MKLTIPVGTSESQAWVILYSTHWCHIGMNPNIAEEGGGGGGVIMHCCIASWGVMSLGAIQHALSRCVI